MNNAFLHIKVIVLMMVLVLLSGCYQDIVDIDFASPRDQLVVEAIVTNELKQHAIYLTATSTYDDPDYFAPVSGATVSISDDEGNVYGVAESEDGKYLTEPLQGIPERRYKLSIDYNYEHYESFSTMPEAIELDSVKFSKVNDLVDFYTVSCYFSDNPGIINQALIRIMKNGIYYDGSDFLYNGNYFDGEDILLDDFNEYFVNEDEVKVEIYSFDESSYEIYRHIDVRADFGYDENEEDPGFEADDLLGMTDFNISNISNNGIGIFSMQYHTLYTTVVDEE